MPLRNRVTPGGEIIAHPGRGLFMGNRGILHDATGRIVRSHATKAWITCLLDFKGRKPPVPLVSPGTYTRLFFLDEAVALAAGHRPCAECRREAYNRFRAIWEAAGLGLSPRAPELDACLHDARRGLRARLVPIEALPDGAFLREGKTALLLRKGQIWPYTPGGYGAPTPAPPRGTKLEVLTPDPLLRVISAGYRPFVHPSARSA